jgi:hypothetical protein
VMKEDQVEIKRNASIEKELSCKEVRSLASLHYTSSLGDQLARVAYQRSIRRH